MAFEPHAAMADVAIMNRETADIAVVPKRKKVALVGFASNTLHLVPWFDPEFEIWGMNQGHMNFQRRADRWMEMHLPEATQDMRDPNYDQFLKNCPVPLYMIRVMDEYPNSVRFPIEEAIRVSGGRDYFTSTVAFMMALALMEGFTEVHLYGINLAIGDEWFYEKACAEFWIGYLEGHGIKVHVPSASSLMKQHRRYGYSIDARPAQSLKLLLQARVNAYRSQAEQFQSNLNTVLGAMREAESLMQVAEGVDHGADIVLVAQPEPQLAPSTG